MEVMFMQVFEHRDWVEAQMRQQVASFSDSLACAFLAAGSQPPLWLFPHSTPAKGKQGNIVRKQSLDLANLKRDDAVHFAHPTSHQVFKPKPLEFGGIKPGSCNITGSSETINQCKSSMSETILSKFTSVHPLNEDLSSTISIEASLHELLHSVSNPLPKKETTHAAENYSLEGPTSGAPKILGLLEKDILDDDRGHSPHPKKNMLEDGCRHDTHSHVCGAFNTCSLQSAPNLEKLLHKSVNDEHLYQSNILFPGTINHNGSCSASASDAFISARIEPFQMQTSLPKLSPEFDRTTTTVLENDVDKVSNSSPNYCNILYDGDACCISKKISCFPYPDTDVKVATVEDKILTGIDCVACGTLNTENYPITTSPTTFPRYALYEKNQHASLEFDEEGIDGGQQVSDGAIPCQSVDVYADCDETVQQYQSFSIPVPSKTKSSTIKERVFLGLRESTKLFDLSCNLSTKYKMGSKMKPLCGKYESLAARLEKLAKRCSINSVDTDWHDPSYDINKLRDPDKYSSDLNDPLLMSNVLTYDSENANSVQEDIDIPLTPLVEKYSLEKLSGRTRFNSECMGSIPELACFQIHEDSNIAEEDEKEEMLTGCPGINYSTKELTGRKPPDHVTSVYQNREKSSSLSIRYVDVGRFGLTTPKTSSMNANRDLHIRTDQAMKNPKENRASSIRKGKLSQPLQDSKSRAELLNQKNARHRSEANLGKGWKPSNTVTNMTPFAPLVKQNQQFRACVKEDTRVKALEAAEAAKCRQEKKKNKRDMRRAAAEQKQKQKQKQVKQKNKIDTDVTRKRQREDDTNKEKGKKKKYTDGAQIPEQQVDRMHATNGQKYGIRKNYDDKEPRHDLVGGLKHELVPCERAESVRKFIASESNDLKAVVADGRSECSVLQLQENFSDDVDKSYEMSPCKDSDEEDNDNFEHHEEVRRRRKFIPSWSREENLDKILLSNQSLDPAEIFARNGCFSLSDVLALHVPQRIFS